MSRTGISPCSEFQDQGGPIARTVSDAAALLNVMSGYDKEDPTTKAVRGKKLPDFTKSLSADGLKGKRLALLTTNLGDDPEVTKIVRQAVADMTKLGAEVIELDVPELHVPTLIKNNDVQQWEQKIDLNKYLAALGAAAPVKDIEAYVATGLLTPSIAKDMAAKAAEKNPEKNPEYAARKKKNVELRAFVEKLMKEKKIDAFLYPLQTVLVVETNDPRGQTGRNGLMASVTGLPAITLPGGFSTPTSTAPLGVPVGVELMGAPFSEEALIHMGYSYEQATKHRKPPVSVPDLDFSSVQ
jgi:Asp-tRNA(Asn)/Glu-tRNA(Gln) amidotransferase A subunit family amidase